MKLQPSWLDLQHMRQVDEWMKYRYMYSYNPEYNDRFDVRPPSELQPGTSAAVSV